MPKREDETPRSWWQRLFHTGRRPSEQHAQILWASVRQDSAHKWAPAKETAPGAPPWADEAALSRLPDAPPDPYHAPLPTFDTEELGRIVREKRQARGDYQHPLYEGLRIRCTVCHQWSVEWHSLAPIPYLLTGREIAGYICVNPNCPSNKPS